VKPSPDMKVRGGGGDTSNTTIPAPSPITNPSLFSSKGREAFSGSSLNLLAKARMRLWPGACTSGCGISCCSSIQRAGRKKGKVPEAGKGQRVNACLRAAGDHYVSVTVLNEARGVTQRVGARSTGRDACVVGP